MVGKARARVILKKYVSAWPLSYFNIFLFPAPLCERRECRELYNTFRCVSETYASLKKQLQCKKILAHVIHVCRCRYRSTDKYTTDSKCTNIMCTLYTLSKHE